MCLAKRYSKVPRLLITIVIHKTHWNNGTVELLLMAKFCLGRPKPPKLCQIGTPKKNVWGSLRWIWWIETHSLPKRFLSPLVSKLILAGLGWFGNPEIFRKRNHHGCYCWIPSYGLLQSLWTSDTVPCKVNPNMDSWASKRNRLKRTHCRFCGFLWWFSWSSGNN